MIIKIKKNLHVERTWIVVCTEVYGRLQTRSTTTVTLVHEPTSMNNVEYKTSAHQWGEPERILGSTALFT